MRRLLRIPRLNIIERRDDLIISMDLAGAFSRHRPRWLRSGPFGTMPFGLSDLIE